MSEIAILRSSLGPLEPLGKGGTAEVFRVKLPLLSEFPELVYKEYKDKTIHQAGPGLGPGLHSIVASRDRLHEVQRRLIDERTLWPVRLIEDSDGAVCGVLMRLIPDRFFQEVRAPSGEVKTQPRELQLLFMDDDYARRRGVPTVSLRTRLELCAQVARILGLLHKAGIVYGDVSARNVIYDSSVAGRPETVLVDCDSVRLAGTRSPFGSQPHTPTWEPPESQQAKRRLAVATRSGSATTSEIRILKQSIMTQSKPTDVYKFGLLVTRVLDYGQGRSPNKNPSKAEGILRKFGGQHLASLLRASLAEDPHDRPNMRDWFQGMTGSDGESAKRQRIHAQKAPELVGEVVGSWQWVEGKGWIRRMSAGA